MCVFHCMCISLCVYFTVCISVPPQAGPGGWAQQPAAPVRCPPGLEYLAMVSECVYFTVCISLCVYFTVCVFQFRPRLDLVDGLNNHPLLSGVHLASSTWPWYLNVCISLCVFHCVYFTVCISLCVYFTVCVFQFRPRLDLVVGLNNHPLLSGVHLASSTWPWYLNVYISLCVFHCVCISLCVFHCVYFTVCVFHCVCISVPPQAGPGGWAQQPSAPVRCPPGLEYLAMVSECVYFTVCISLCVFHCVYFSSAPGWTWWMGSTTSRSCRMSTWPRVPGHGT